MQTGEVSRPGRSIGIMPTSHDETLTIAQAALRCSVSVDTVRRRLRAHQFPRAHQDGTGAWRVPVGDLVTAGLRPSLAGADDDLGVFASSDVAALREELVQARLEVAVARAHLEAATKVEAAHQAHIEDLREEVAHLRSRSSEGLHNHGAVGQH